jgi:hypothetical protein
VAKEQKNKGNKKLQQKRQREYSSRKIIRGTHHRLGGAGFKWSPTTRSQAPTNLSSSLLCSLLSGLLGGLLCRLSRRLSHPATLGGFEDLGLVDNGRSSSGGLARLGRVSLGPANRLLSSGGGGLLGGLGLLGLLSLLGLLGSRLLSSSSLGGSLLSSRLGGSFLLGKLHGSGRALGLKELALLNTSLDGLVELAVKGVGGGRSNLVVRLNIFLDRLAAATIALFQIQDSILDHITVGSVAGAGLLGGGGTGGGSLLGRHDEGGMGVGYLR